jgi:hypothetical protein
MPHFCSQATLKRFGEQTYHVMDANILTGTNKMTQARQSTASKPYEIVGAGQLVSAVWKKNDDRGGWGYRFNVYRMSARDGGVSHLLRPADLESMVKLCQVLAATLADDGCMPARERRALADLAAELDEITDKGN